MPTLMLAYTTATADLTSIGGAANQTVIDGIAQEIDISTGKVLFQWNSADHIPYNDSKQPLPMSASTPWDWFHINAVNLAKYGNLLIDARNTWTTYKVSRHTGDVLWKLGGKDSSFTPQAADGQTLDNAGELPRLPAALAGRRLRAASPLAQPRGGPSAARRPEQPAPPPGRSAYGAKPGPSRSRAWPAAR